MVEKGAGLMNVGGWVARELRGSEIGRSILFKHSVVDGAGWEGSVLYKGGVVRFLMNNTSRDGKGRGRRKKTRRRSRRFVVCPGV